MTNATQSALRGPRRDPSGKGRTAFGGIDKSAVRRTSGEPDYRAIQQSVEFRDLKRRVKWFIFPMTAFFLLWYIGYVVTAAYARDFMAQRLVGEINVGLVMGLGQFVTTVGITLLYARFAARHIDPRVDDLKRNAGGADR
jgi:uncharacterized membrane protein (DUF485 family)